MIDKKSQNPNVNDSTMDSMLDEVRILKNIEKMFKPRRNKNWYFKQEHNRAIARSLNFIAQHGNPNQSQSIEGLKFN